LIAEKFEKWTKIKLLSTFQLATLFAKANVVSLKRIFFPLARPSHRVMHEQNNVDYHQMERKQAGEG